jgi:hypothetical protein
VYTCISNICVRKHTNSVCYQALRPHHTSADIARYTDICVCKHTSVYVYIHSCMRLDRLRAQGNITALACVSVCVCCVCQLHVANLIVFVSPLAPPPPPRSLGRDTQALVSAAPWSVVRMAAHECTGHNSQKWASLPAKTAVDNDDEES